MYCVYGGNKNGKFIKIILTKIILSWFEVPHSVWMNEWMKMFILLSYNCYFFKWEWNDRIIADSVYICHGRGMKGEPSQEVGD